MQIDIFSSRNHSQSLAQIVIKLSHSCPGVYFALSFVASTVLFPTCSTEFQHYRIVFSDVNSQWHVSGKRKSENKFPFGTPEFVKFVLRQNTEGVVDKTTLFHTRNCFRNSYRCWHWHNSWNFDRDDIPLLPPHLSEKVGSLLAHF